jgi:hypothetical protein
MKLILIAAALVLLAGCVPTKWTKPGADAATFEQDKQQCIYEVDLHNQAPGGNPFNVLTLVPECLRAKGYTSG